MKHRTTIWLAGLISAFLLLGLLAGCGGGSSTKPDTNTMKEHKAPKKPTKKQAPKAAASRKYAIKITSAGFQPGHLAAKAGATIVWTNTGGKPREVHADDESFKSPELKPGDSYSLKIGDATITYHDHLNEEDQGVIMVMP